MRSADSLHSRAVDKAVEGVEVKRVSLRSVDSLHSKGFILSLEPAVSLLLLMLLISYVYIHFYLPFQEYSQVILQMHQTDAWLVEDSINYYNTSAKLILQKEWMKKELNLE